MKTYLLSQSVPGINWNLFFDETAQDIADIQDADLTKIDNSDYAVMINDFLNDELMKKPSAMPVMFQNGPMSPQNENDFSLEFKYVEIGQNVNVVANSQDRLIVHPKFEPKSLTPVHENIFPMIYPCSSNHSSADEDVIVDDIFFNANVNKNNYGNKHSSNFSSLMENSSSFSIEDSNSFMENSFDLLNINNNNQQVNCYF